MLKSKILSGLIIGCLSLSIIAMSCSTSQEDVEYSNDRTSLIKNGDPESELDDVRSMFQQFSEQKNITSEAEILSVDDSPPVHLSGYLKELNKENESFDHIEHIKIDTKEFGIVDVSGLRYASNPLKFLIIYEGDFDENIALDLDVSFPDDNDFKAKSGLGSGTENFGLGITGGKTYPLTNPVTGVHKFDGKCFKKCIKGALDTDGLMGMILWGLGISSYFCPPCAALATTYSVVVLIGCAGGCNH